MAMQADVITLPQRSPVEFQTLQEDNAAAGAIQQFWHDKRVLSLAKKEHLSNPVHGLWQW